MKKKGERGSESFGVGSVNCSMSRKLAKRKIGIKCSVLKNKSSVSQLITTASFKNRIKLLLKNNKSLAQALEESKRESAGYLKIVQEYSKDSSQVMFARKKLKNMAEVIQLLVSDLSEVMKMLDVKPINLLKSLQSKDLRCQLKEPDIYPIEETSHLNASMDSSESFQRIDDSTKKQKVTYLPHIPVSPACKEDSVTEIYDVQTLLQCSLPKNSKLAFGSKAAEKRNFPNLLSKSPFSFLKSPCTPSKIPKKPSLLEKMERNPPKLFLPMRKGASNKSTCIQSLKNTAPSEVKASAEISKSTDVHNTKLQTDRRQTFVIAPLVNSSESSMPFFSDSSDKKPTLSPLSPPAPHLHCRKSSPRSIGCSENRRKTFLACNISVDQTNKRGTFSVSKIDGSEIISDKTASTFNALQRTIKDPPSKTDVVKNETILMPVDMELTEVVPHSILCTLNDNLPKGIVNSTKAAVCSVKLKETNQLPNMEYSAKNTATKSDDEKINEGLEKFDLPETNSSNQTTVQNVLSAVSNPSTSEVLKHKIIDTFQKKSMSKSKNPHLPETILHKSMSPMSEDDFLSQPSVPHSIFHSRKSLKPNRRGPFVFEHLAKKRKSSKLKSTVNRKTLSENKVENVPSLLSSSSEMPISEERVVCDDLGNKESKLLDPSQNTIRATLDDCCSAFEGINFAKENNGWSELTESKKIISSKKDPLFNLSSLATEADKETTVKLKKAVSVSKLAYKRKSVLPKQKNSLKRSSRISCRKSSEEMSNKSLVEEAKKSSNEVNVLSEQKNC